MDDEVIIHGVWVTRCRAGWGCGVVRSSAEQFWAVDLWGAGNGEFAAAAVPRYCGCD